MKRRIGDLNFDLTAQNSGNVDLTGVVFKVTVFDPETMAHLKTFRTSGIAMPKAASHNDTLAYGSKVELQPGAYPVALTAEYTYEGVAKNVPLDSAGFVVTNAAPVANAGSDRQVEADSAAGASVALDGSASTDENSTDSALKNDIVKYEWKLGDQVIGTGETITTTLPAGENSVTLTVTDSCGLSSNATVKITVVVTSVPKITDLSPANGTITQDSAIGATVTDAISGIDWTSIDFRAGEEILTASYNEETGRITSSLPVQDGWYDLVLKVKNLANREATSPTWRICLDRTAPVVSNQTPGNGSETENKAPEISVVISDTLSGIDSSTLELKVNGTVVAHTYNSETGKVSFQASDLAEAVQNVVLTVRDKAGNEASSAWSFTVVPPAVPGVSGALTLNPETVKRRIGDLSLAVAANNSGNVALSGVTFTVKLMNVAGDTVLKEFSEVGNLPLEGSYAKNYAYGSKVELAPGTYPVTLAATYTFGGKEQTVQLATKQLTVTNTAPMASAGPDQEITATATAMNVTLDASASTDENSTDDAKQNDIIGYEWKQGERLLSNEMNPTVSLGLGVHEITLTVTDTCGATSSDTVKITVADKSAPVISDQTPANGSETENKAPEISAVISDTLSGIDNSTIELKVNGTVVAHTYNSETGKVSFQASDLAEAVQNVVLTVRDKAGNEASSAWAFTVVAPAVPGISGTLMLNPETVKRRIGDLSLAVSASNTGNVELTGVTFTVKLMNTSGDTVLKEFSEAGNLPLEGIYSKTYTYGSKVELAPGIYPVTLAATYTFGGKEQSVTLDTKQLTVTNTAPVANAGPDQDITAAAVPMNVVLNASGSTDENSTDDAKRNDIVSYEWKLGEQVLSTEMNPTVPLGLGIHEVTLTVTDTCGATGTGTVKITVADKTVPVITNLTPANDSETENKSPEISAVIADPISGIDSSTIELKLDGTAVAHTYDGNTGKVSFLASELTEAEHNITLTVKDKSGNESSASWSFTVVAPAVPGISGALTLNPETVKRRIGDLSLAVSASNTGNVELTGVTFTVKLMNTSGDTVLKEFSEAGNLPLEGIYSKTYTYGSKVELAPGIYPVTLAATYTFGGKEQSVTLDTKQLTVTNTAPVANAGSDQAVTATSPSGAEITLNGSASWDENSTDVARKNDIVSYEWKEGETKLGENEILTVTLVPGVHEITLTVIDSCGAAHSDTVKVTVNRIILPPSISELAPAHETITKELALSAKATDAVWGIDWTTLVFKAGETVLAATHDSETGAIVSALPSDSPDGWYDLNIFIKNLGGGEATTETWRVGLDRTAPVIMELKPEADAYTSTAAPTISAKITDAMSGVEPAGIVVKVGDTVLESAYDAETGVVTAVVPDALADGWQTVRIDAADKVGNTGSAEWRIGIDITPPTITGMIPTADSVIDQTSQEISVVVSDETSGINADTIAMSIDGSAVMFTHAETTGKVSFNATGLTSGIHTVTVAVSDKAGNSSNATWKFNVELEIPENKYLLFHNSKSGELDISGGNKMINGIAHSNAAIKVRGNHTAITGKTTAVGAISVKGKDHNIALQQSNAPEVVMPVYPYEYYVANATQVHNGDWSVGKGQNVPAGIHLVNGNVTVQGDINASVTIVATGNITIKSQTVNLTSADTQYKVALYSRDGNISFSSNGVSVNGIIYAPGGTCKVSSNGSNFTGGIIADMIDFSGQNLTLNPFDYAGGEE